MVSVYDIEYYFSTNLKYIDLFKEFLNSEMSIKDFCNTEPFNLTAPQAKLRLDRINEAFVSNHSDLLIRHGVSPYREEGKYKYVSYSLANTKKNRKAFLKAIDDVLELKDLYNTLKQEREKLEKEHNEIIQRKIEDISNDARYI